MSYSKIMVNLIIVFVRLRNLEINNKCDIILEMINRFSKYFYRIQFKKR